MRYGNDLFLSVIINHVHSDDNNLKNDFHIVISHARREQRRETVVTGVGSVDVIHTCQTAAYILTNDVRCGLHFYS
jgi:hypothetical protein